MGYEALVPVYQQLDGPSMQVADALSPLGDPKAEAIPGFDFDLTLEFAAPELPGADALGAGDLPLSADTLDPATVTALLEGGTLPGL